MRSSSRRPISTDGDLRSIQRVMHAALLRPLAPGNRMQATWVDGRPMSDVVAEFIKPNDRLTAFDRLEIYNRMYWFRLIDCVYDDNPGLRALLGERAFNRLVIEYLAAHPSQSFTLRNLCSHLVEFIRRHPSLTAPWTKLALEVAQFEWAQTVAFDGLSRPVITAPELASANPARLRLGLQPYVTLLALRHPIDSYVIAVKRRNVLRAEASNATTSARPPARLKHVPRPRAERIWVAVHRLDNRLYYKRLEPAAFKILSALRDGEPLTRAVAAGGRGVTPAQVQEWFSVWSNLGWICRRK